MPTRPLGGTMRNELGLPVPVGVGATVPDDRIPLSKLVPAGSASLLIGRQSGSSGDWQEITLGSGLSMSGTTLSAVGGGTGDVVGPASATDNAVARFDTTTGKLIQNSAVTIDDSGNVATSGTVDGRDLSTDGTKLDGIESGADVTDATNVAAAGAAMTANNLSDLANAGTARTNLGLGSLATVTPTGTPDGTKFLRDDNAWVTPSGGGNSFETISVSGQSDVVADSATDTLTLVAGSNITITTNAGTDTITIAASGGGAGESFHPFLLAGI